MLTLEKRAPGTPSREFDMAKSKTGSEKARGSGKSAAEKRVEAANRRIARQRAKGPSSGPVPF